MLLYGKSVTHPNATHQILFLNIRSWGGECTGDNPGSDVLESTLVHLIDRGYSHSNKLYKLNEGSHWEFHFNAIVDAFKGSPRLRASILLCQGACCIKSA